MRKTPPPLFKHQEQTIKFLLENPRAVDLSDPGTGKTRSQIEAFTRRRLDGGKKALVVAPKSLLNAAWRNDFQTFSPFIRTSVAYANNREKAFAADADVYIINTDGVNWLVKQPPSFFKQFDTLIIDELTAFKHHTSQRSKNLAKIAKYFKYRYGMTGTPNTNTVADLWHQMFVIDDGARLGKSFYRFRDSVCKPERVGPAANMVKWVDKPEALAAVGILLKGFTIRHVFEECIDIPENYTYPVTFDMSPLQATAYDAMRANAILLASNGKTIVGINAAAVVTKLLQIASGAVYDGLGGYSVVDTGRYELIADLVQQREHSVVFFNWDHQRDLLQEEFRKRGITFVTVDGGLSDKARMEAVDSFQKGYYQVFLAHPQSAAHGLTLTKGTATIWSSPTYNLEHFLQGNRRIYRAGQTERTETIKIVAAGTIESKVYDKLENKQSLQDDLLGLLKENNE